MIAATSTAPHPAQVSLVTNRDGLTPLWQAACARFMPSVADDRIPGGLLERFAGTAAESLTRLLFFLTPLTVSRPITLQEGW
ncbi:MAG: hypothetical protein ACYCTW_05015 [Sulfuricella sp.]